MLMYPLAFYTTDALSWFKAIKWKRFKIEVYRITMFYVVLSTAILSFGFIFMNSETPFLYFNPSQFNSYSNQIPSSMQQNTLPISDCNSATNALHWFKNNINSSAILLTHTVFYGWALLTLSMNQVRNYGFDDSGDAAITVQQEGYTQVYLICWVNGEGWYGQPTLPISFHQVYQNVQTSS